MFAIRKRKPHYGTFANKRQRVEETAIIMPVRRTTKMSARRKTPYKRRNTALAYPNGKWWTPKSSITATKNNKWQTIWVSLPASEFTQDTPNNISINDIRTQITAQLGFTPTTYKVHSLRVWNQPGVGASQNNPKIKLRVNALTNNSTFQNGPFMGEMEDNGELNQAARLAFSWPHTQTQKVWGCTETSGVLADVTPSKGLGVVAQVHVSYFGLEKSCVNPTDCTQEIDEIKID